jgi:hypothetical protein
VFVNGMVSLFESAMCAVHWSCKGVFFWQSAKTRKRHTFPLCYVLRLVHWWGVCIVKSLARLCGWVCRMPFVMYVYLRFFFVFCVYCSKEVNIFS